MIGLVDQADVKVTQTPLATVVTVINNDLRHVSNTLKINLEKKTRLARKDGSNPTKFRAG